MNSRYDFGRNWSELAERFDIAHVEQATADLSRLVGDLQGKTFLDIGSGSGLHSVAATRLGASKIYALDYDPDSVETSRAVLSRFASSADWQVERGDALDPSKLPATTYDVVYSWGVLHHTGDMWTAIRNAAGCVAPGGRLALALYLETPFCSAWKTEKRLYANNRWLRPLIKWPYVAAFLAAKQLRSGKALAFVRDYRQTRGMEFLVDVDDWLGGYPYESVEPRKLERFIEDSEFTTIGRHNTRAGSGLFGTGCGEWLFQKSA